MLGKCLEFEMLFQEFYVSLLQTLPIAVELIEINKKRDLNTNQVHSFIYSIRYSRQRKSVRVWWP